MADVEITHDEVRGIDINQVASMQLKDGTVVVVNSEATAEAGDYQGEEEFAQEEVDQVEYDQAGQEEVDQSNELRARPMVRMPYGGVRPVVPVRPAVVPVRPAVVPVRPPVFVPKPVPRGPVVRPVMPMGGVFRARPGMPVRPVVPVRPAQLFQFVQQLFQFVHPLLPQNQFQEDQLLDQECPWEELYLEQDQECQYICLLKW